jgi:hypothetical protein
MEQFNVHLKYVIRNEIMVLPVILYGCENWALMKQCARRIEILEMKFLYQYKGYALYDHCSI